MAGIHEMAKDLGAALARTDEYQALRRAMDAADQDRELTELRNRIRAIEEQIEAALRTGREPDDELKKQYGEVAEELQTKPAFQRLIAAQTNFEKLMMKVNETVSKGIEEGARSRIVLPS